MSRICAVKFKCSKHFLSPGYSPVYTNQRPISSAEENISLLPWMTEAFASYARLALIMSTISFTMFTFGYSTYPLFGPDCMASGWVGSYTRRPWVVSFVLSRTRTPFPGPLSWSDSRNGLLHVGWLEAIGSRMTDFFWYFPPSGVRVVLALAMLSLMTSVRRRSTLVPVAAMLILVKRPIYSSRQQFYKVLFLNSCFNLIEFEAFQLGEQAVLHLNLRDVHRLFLCVNVVAVRLAR